jgi:hypothetical protein
MKIRTSVFAGLLFLSSLGAVNSAIAADDGVISKQEFAAGSYCHEKFRAMRPGTLYTDHASLQSSGSADIVDYYGPCDESPVGQDQIREQKMDREDRGRWDVQDYAD